MKVKINISIYFNVHETKNKEHINSKSKRQNAYWEDCCEISMMEEMRQF